MTQSPLRFLVDNDLDERKVRGWERRCSDLDAPRLRDLGLERTPDPEVLEWAASHGRVVVTSDVSTMVGAANRRLVEGVPMPGVIVVPQDLAIGRAIEDLALIRETSRPSDLELRIVFLPL